MEDPLEREALLAAAGERVAAARRGSGGVVAYEGPAGIGKTTVLAAAAERARGMAVVRALPSELERTFAYGVARRLLAPLLAALAAAELDVLRRSPAAAALRVLESAGAGEAGEAEHAVVHGLAWLLADAAARAPVLLVLDDAHWADEPSLAWLAYVATRVGDLPVAILIATRAVEPRDPGGLARLLAMREHVAVLPVPALSPAAVRTLVARGHGDGAATREGERIAAATGGNPFLVTELLRAWAAGDPPEPLPVTLTLRRAVSRRIAQAGPHAAALAEAVALLGGDGVAPLDAAGLARLAPDEARAAAAGLCAADVLTTGTRLGFVHPLVREAVYATMTPLERAERHARAARIAAAGGRRAGRRRRAPAGHAARRRPLGGRAAPRRRRRGAGPGGARARPAGTCGARWRSRRPARRASTSCASSARRPPARTPPTPSAACARRWRPAAAASARPPSASRSAASCSAPAAAPTPTRELIARARRRGRRRAGARAAHPRRADGGGARARPASSRSRPPAGAGRDHPELRGATPGERALLALRWPTRRRPRAGPPRSCARSPSGRSATTGCSTTPGSRPPSPTRSPRRCGSTGDYASALAHLDAALDARAPARLARRLRDGARRPRGGAPAHRRALRGGGRRPRRARDRRGARPRARRAARPLPAGAGPGGARAARRGRGRARGPRLRGRDRADGAAVRRPARPRPRSGRPAAATRTPRPTSSPSGAGLLAGRHAHAGDLPLALRRRPRPRGRRRRPARRAARRGGARALAERAGAPAALGHGAARGGARRARPAGARRGCASRRAAAAGGRPRRARARA